jgi:pimeloyl-ACP methyl ester carboxylesterase
MGTKRKNRALRRVIIILVVIAILYLGIGAYAASSVTEVGDHTIYNDTPQTFGAAYEDVSFPARVDGLNITAWYLPHETSEHAVILVHGRDASKQWAISGTFPKFGAALNRAGFAVLMIDLRGHGDSEGERYSFGVFERRDVLGAVDFLLDKGFEPGDIGVLGISLGGGAVNGAAAEDTAIGAVVVDSTFADINPLVGDKWEEESGLPNFFLPGFYLMNRIMYGYDLPKVLPVEDVAQIAPRPMLILHCTTDEDVDVSHAYQLKEAAPQAELWIQEGCDHAEVYRDFPEEYEDHVITFFLENLK